MMQNASGVIIDILNEMSTKLNFTYVLHVAQVSTNLNTTDELNATVSENSSTFVVGSVFLKKIFRSRDD